jgi:GNAT superfamily N-acetyltransferase
VDAKAALIQAHCHNVRRYRRLLETHLADIERDYIELRLPEENEMTIVQTFIVEPRTPELAICARWRANAFSVLEASFEQELGSLELFAADQSNGVALVAKVDGEPCGTCLLVESEIEPNHDVSPWLAGLFVVPEHRRKGAGSALVRAIEAQARQRGVSRLYLYTTEAVEFYVRLGWTVLDRTKWKGFDTALMVRDLSGHSTHEESAT